MSDDKDRMEEKEALKALHEAANALRRANGEKEIPYIYAEPEPPYCSFCGKGKNEYRALVEGPSVFICDECVKFSCQILEREGIKWD